MNSIAITGRLVDDPTRVETKRGVTTRFRVAVDCRPRLWIDVETWGHLAGRSAQYLHRSRQVGVTGRLACDEWADRQGSKHNRWKIVAVDVTFLDRPELDPAAETAPDSAMVSPG